jgi:CRISPR system Cascade subunit CasA
MTGLSSARPEADSSFNLLDERWVPVIVGSSTTDVSLLELFRRADRLDRLGGEIGTMNFALLRLLLAILHRAFVAITPPGSEGARERAESLRDRWHEDGLPAVAEYLESHRRRFFLFHPSAPFYQVSDLRAARDEVSDLGRLVAERPPYLATRSARGLRRISAADAARWLVHVHAYDVSGIKTGVLGHPRARGGKVYPEGVGWCGQLGGLHLLGASLLDTLLLNLWANGAPPPDIDRDLPPWERTPDSVGDDRDLASRPWGPVDLYTWQPRRVRLVGGTDGVTGVVLTYGDRFLIQERQVVVTDSLEPLTGWRFSKPQTAKYHYAVEMPREHNRGVQLWRTMPTLLGLVQVSKPDVGRSAGVVEHVAAFAESPLLVGGVVRLHATGVAYGSNNSVFDDVFDDGLDLPTVLLEPEGVTIRALAIAAVEAAQKGVEALRDAARRLATASGGSGAAIEGPGQRAVESGYARLDRPYRRWLLDLAREKDDLSAAEAVWHAVAADELQRLGDELASQVSTAAWRGYDAKGPRDDVGKILVRFDRDLDRVFPKRRLGRTIPLTGFKTTEAIGT